MSSAWSIPSWLILPERVAEEKVDDDYKKYPRLPLLLLLEETQERLGDDLVAVVDDAAAACLADGSGIRGGDRRQGRLRLAPAAAPRLVRNGSAVPALAAAAALLPEVIEKAGVEMGLLICWDRPNIFGLVLLVVVFHLILDLNIFATLWAYVRHALLFSGITML